MTIFAAVTLGPAHMNSLGRPHGWRRATPHQGRILTPRAEREYQRRVATLLWADRAHRVGRLIPISPTEPVNVTVCCFFRRPKSGPNATASGCMVKPDLDNVVKSILDAVQLETRGTPALLADDAQVVSIHVSKQWADPGEERVEISLWSDDAPA